MAQLFQDELYSSPATPFSTSGGTADAGVAGPPVQQRPAPRQHDLRKQAISQMGGAEKFFSAIGEFGAGVTGRPSPLNARIQQQQEDRLARLQEFKVHTEALEDGVKMVSKLRGSARKQFITQYAEQLDSLRPGLGATYESLADQPDMAAVLAKYKDRSPTIARTLELDPSGEAALKLLSSPDAIKTINAEIDSSVLPTLHKKGQTILMGWQQLVPPQLVDRINADERVTASEFLAVNEWIKENKPEAAATTFSDEELQIVSRNGDAFYGALGIVPPKDEVDIVKKGVEQSADVAITKQAAAFANKKLGVVERATGGDPIEDIYWESLSDEEKAQIEQDTGAKPPTVVEDQRASIENDPEWHRRRAEFFRSKGRDDLADAAIKQANDLQTTDKGRAAQAAMMAKTLVREGFTEDEAQQIAESVASGRRITATDPQSGATRIIDVASKKLIAEFSAQTDQAPVGSTATPTDIKPGEATGPASVLKNVGNVVADFFGKDIPFKDTAKAANAMENLRINTLSVMQEAGSWRPSVFTSKLLDEVTQKPLQFFKGDRLSRERMESTRRMILQEVETIDRSLSSRALRPEAVSDYTKNRAQLSQLAKEYEVVVGAFDKKFKKAKAEDFWVN
ncbi:MAG: hypothetical protein NUV75_11745 [Gallionella sp.]|nr:hypothetical protein [Gallionella sp.]